MDKQEADKILDNLEIEMNKVIKHMDWLIVQPSFIEKLIDNEQAGYWGQNYIRIKAVEIWVRNMKPQIEAKMPKDARKTIDEIIDENSEVKLE